jgi:hypothetical protein
MTGRFLRASAVSAVGVALCVATLAADDRSVTSEKGVDFSKFKTFLVRETTVKSSRPELSNPLFASQIGDAVRVALKAKGLTESTAAADLVIQTSVTGIDYSIGTAGRANPQPLGRSSSSFAPVAFTEGTVVVDLMSGDPAKLVWHGVYRRSRDSAPKLAKRLPEEVGKLLKDYPPKAK